MAELTGRELLDAVEARISEMREPANMTTANASLDCIAALVLRQRDLGANGHSTDCRIYCDRRCDCGGPEADAALRAWLEATRG